MSGADRKSVGLKRLAPYVLAPEESIKYGFFKKPLDKADIGQRVERRVQAYDGEKDQLFYDWFKSALDHMEIRSLSWESILEFIGSVDTAYSIGLQDFYQKC